MDENSLVQWLLDDVKIFKESQAKALEMHMNQILNRANRLFIGRICKIELSDEAFVCVGIACNKEKELSAVYMKDKKVCKVPLSEVSFA